MDKYVNPLTEKYASNEMQHIFSPNFKFSTWRKLWVSLAKNQRKLGLSFITQEMLDQMQEHIYDIDYEKINEYEIKFKHDVMANIYVFADLCPKAKGIIHLGATSAFVGDNTDLIQIREALILTRKKLVTLVDRISKFALEYKALPTLAYTHFQAAQLTTVGKRAMLWVQSLLYDLENLEYRLENLRFRGVKGTTGTWASFKELFNDYEKVKILDELITTDFNFNKKQFLSGQTYDRKQDSYILEFLSDLAQSSHKITNDFRLLQHLKEIEEPFSKTQVGSSAMAYKRNPIRCERVSSLSKFVISNAQNGALVEITQWFERTLDDSANKRLSISQSFLAIDAILNLLLNIFENVVVYEKMIYKNIMQELPFMATENILMELTKKGFDRQEAHEIIRKYSMQATKNVKLEGLENNLIALLKNDETFKDINLDNILNPDNFIGYAKEQTEDFYKIEVAPILERYKEDVLNTSSEILK